MPRIPDKCRLLHGPYCPPRLHVGARTDCNLRGTVVITSWTDARASWPRCQATGVKWQLWRAARDYSSTP